MNSYTVDYEKSAESELANIWLHAPNTAAVTRASAQIEQLLAQNPIKNGRALSEGLLLLKISPLVAYYTVDQVNRLVVVTDVFHRP